ncbi:hypothetical protein PIB30_091336 [Stylosanthes scabra]|uniref:Uncharacterized protein n=1 Tax=Stylosanthes scabra TaxID=79078 RepID=A0ABU6UY57_9FABA|nr:hypothetical protein [Stylosanthes scabra]
MWFTPPRPKPLQNFSINPRGTITLTHFYYLIRSGALAGGSPKIPQGFRAVDRKRRYSPFECESCKFVTHSFYAWWGAYYKIIVRSFKVIKAGADKLLAEDQPKHPKVVSKQKAEVSRAPKKKAKKTKDTLGSTSNPVQKVQPSPTPTVSSKLATRSTNPLGLATQSDASSGNKVSEVNGDKVTSKPSPPQVDQNALSKPNSPSSESNYSQSRLISSPSHHSESPDLKPNNTRADLPSTRMSAEQHEINVDKETNTEARFHKATSETVTKGVGHSNSVNKSVQLEGAKKIIEEPRIERPPTPIHKLSFSPEVLKAIQWLVHLLSAPIEANVS